MSESVRRELVLPQSRDRVWRAIASSDALAQWMYPNNFEARIGHRFQFHVPANPKANFDGLVVQCEVLECEPPSKLVISWAAAGLADSRVSFRLEPDGDGTRLLFEHSGFDLTQPWGKQALHGAEYGWAKMLKQLASVVAESETV